MIQVLVSGALGRMGTEICKAVDSADDMRLVAGVDPSASDDTTVGTDNGPVFLTLKEAIEVTRPDVVIDFTRPDVAEANVRCALSMGVNCVLGTTGLSEELSPGDIRRVRHGRCRALPCTQLHDRCRAHDALCPTGGQVFPRYRGHRVSS